MTEVMERSEGQAVQPRRTNEMVREVESSIIVGDAQRAMFLPANMGEAMEMATLMAGSNFVPKHLRQRPGDCLAVIMQASRWGMDPYAVGNKTYFVNDRMAFEAQLVSAVVNASNVLDGRLNYEWEGEGENLKCKVSGKVKGDPGIKEREVYLSKITTRNSPLWKQDPEQQLGYFAGRAWARLHTPEVLMGVYTPDEVRDIPGNAEPAKRLTRAALADHATYADEAVDEAEITEVEQSEQSPAASSASQQDDDALSAAGSQEGADAGEASSDDDTPVWQSMVDDWKARIERAQMIGDVIAVRKEFEPASAGLPDDVVGEIEGLLTGASHKIYQQRRMKCLD